MWNDFAFEDLLSSGLCTQEQYDRGYITLNEVYQNMVSEEPWRSALNMLGLTDHYKRLADNSLYSKDVGWINKGGNK